MALVSHVAARRDLATGGNTMVRQDTQDTNIQMTAVSVKISKAD